MRTIILTLALLCVLFSGCFLIAEEEKNVTQNVTPEPAPKPVPTPSFSITSPSDGMVMVMTDDTLDVSLTMSTRNLILKQSGGTAKKGEGHFRITVNNNQTDTAASKIYVMKGLGPGNYTVDVELLNNDGTSYSPAITSQVRFSLEKEAPKEYIPQSYTVAVKDFSYEPAELTLKVGDTVTFVNEGSFPRSATCFMNGAQVFDTKILAAGQSADVTFTETMECEYYSTTFKAMTGKVTVESADTG